MVEVLQEVGADYGQNAGQVAINRLLAKRMLFPIFGVIAIEEVMEDRDAFCCRMSRTPQERLSSIK
jgi:diketogulonate reductase-like aldo/keto reductase